MSYQDFTIMLVDDEPAILKALKRLIRKLKCTIITSDSPLEALDILKESPVDIVISDMKMPEMSGDVFLLEVLKNHPQTERIILSGYADSESIENALRNSKVSYFLHKPWEDKEVINAIEIILNDLSKTDRNMNIDTKSE